MATPVPVVSRMYFFVFTPPKITGSARPAFLAMSVKCARGLGSFLAAWLALKRRENGRSKVMEIRDGTRRNRERWDGPEIMNSWHTKMRVRCGQGGALTEAF